MTSREEELQDPQFVLTERGRRPDALVHLGDYIYEYGTGEYGEAREYQPSHEITTLDDYRTRHAHYKLDPDLQEVHRQHPFITVWDDHETANDSWRGGAENHTEGTEGVWSQRKAWGVQAYAEWLPIRLPDAANPQRIYRQFRYGDLAEFVMLDTRLEGRDEQAGLTDAASINDADRRLISAEQFDFLSKALSGTSAKWKLLGQQVMFGQLRIVGLPELSVLTGLPIEQLQVGDLADVGVHTAHLVLAEGGELLLEGLGRLDGECPDQRTVE